jgi:HlyD family secretion protein
LRRWGVTVLVLSALVAILVFSMRPAQVSVETDSVAYRPLLVTVEEQGRTRAREPYTIAAPVFGQLLRTDKIEGDSVAVGDVLARITVAPENRRTQASLEAALAAAQARRSVAQAALGEAQSLLARATQEAQRREQLFAQRVIGQEERDIFAQASEAALSRENAAQASLLAATAEVESAQSQLLGINAIEPGSVQSILAPVKGTIQQVYEKNERIVAAGTPLFQLSDGDRLELMIDLLTQEAVKVSPGDTILITSWGGPQTLHGRVNYVEPQAFTKYSALGVEEQRVNVIGELTEDNPGLGAQYRIEAAIIVDEFPDALTVPISALFRRENSWQVFVVEQGRVRLQALQIGARSSEHAQVLEGLSDGDRVVIFPSDQVVEGLAVQVLE